jgi:chromate transporter
VPRSTAPCAGERRVGEVARVFLRLGVIGFGGPAAHIAMMRDDVVNRRKWLDEPEFLDLIGATNLIPGPNSTELAIHLGAKRAGPAGLVTAGVCFIAPAVAIVSVLAWLYERYGTTAAAVDLRYGVLPVIVAIVGQALVGLARTALTSWLPIVIAAGATAAYLADVHELLILLVAGALAAGWHGRRALGRRAATIVMIPVLRAAADEPAGASLTRLFLAFLEIGSVLYGSGYVLLAFLQRVFVDDLGWLSTQQILDATAVGQVTPGPVFTTATFVGWIVDGPAGAAVATVGIFLPAFVFVALLEPLVAWMRRHPAARSFLTGVTAASLGLMAGVLVDLADAALDDWFTVALAAGALAVLVVARPNSAWIVGAGAVVGVAHAVLA